MQGPAFGYIMPLKLLWFLDAFRFFLCTQGFFSACFLSDWRVLRIIQVFEFNMFLLTSSSKNFVTPYSTYYIY